MPTIMLKEIEVKEFGNSLVIVIPRQIARNNEINKGDIFPCVELHR